MSFSLVRLSVAALGLALASPGVSQDAIAQGAKAPRAVASNESLVAPAISSARRGDALTTRVSIKLVRVPLEQALQEIAGQVSLVATFGPSVTRDRRLVTVERNDIAADEALGIVLAGTGLQYTVSGRLLVIERGRALADGAISGKVTSRKTGQPIVGATILLDGASKGVQTGEDGTFRVVTSVGEHSVTVRAVGFVKQSRTVTVTEGGQVAVELILEPSASVLDEVVVTGTVVATERKAIPTPITVITAADLEKRNITRVDQLFRGEIPGLIALDRGSQVYGAEAGLGGMVSSKLYTRGSSDLGGGANPIKTYIDGVELLDPSYLGTIDPKSIERIEIITGPQAATIYGSGALGGVMQIFTKHGAGKTSPDFTVNLQYGMLQSSLSSSRSPQHNHSLLMSGGAGPVFTYSGNVSYQYTGQWQPKLFNRGIGTQLGATHTHDAIVVSGSAALTSTTNGLSGRGGIGWGSLLEKVLRTDGTWTPEAYSNVWDVQQISRATSQIFSLSGDYRPFSFWQHHVTVGRSQNEFAFVPRLPSYQYPDDSLFTIQRSMGNRWTGSYNMTVQSPRLGFLSSNLTVGMNGSRGAQTTVYGCKGKNSETTLSPCNGWTEVNVNQSIDDQSYGGFGSWQIGVADRFFLTLGLRGEHNPNYGRDHSIDWTPTNGATYTIEYGDLTVKLLASYGRATRPPLASQRLEVVSLNTSRDPAQLKTQLAAPDLTPEYERGPQGGVELYYGNLGSLTVNRYRQRVTNLIIWVPVDSIVCQYTWSSVPSICYQTQYQNLNTVAKQGWEGTASLNLGPVTMRGTYSWNDSRIESVSKKYPYASSYAIGSMFTGVPSHTGNVTASYAHGGTSITASVNYMGASIQNGLGRASDFQSLSLYTRLLMYTDRINQAWDSWIQPGYTRSDLSASQRLTSWASATLNVTNLFNDYSTDVGPLYPSIGRQTFLGMSIRFPRR